MHARTRLLIECSLIAAAGCALLAGCHDRAALMEEAASQHSPLIGAAAPNFTLQDQDEKPVTLSDMRGKWVVLYFYPKDDTPGCTCQATEFTALLGQFRDMDAPILGISPDPPAAHRRFIKTHKLGLRLLSDPAPHTAMRDYGAWTDETVGGVKYGRVIRSTFIIGPDGTIRYHWPEVIPQGHAARVSQKLAELKKQAK